MTQIRRGGGALLLLLCCQLAGGQDFAAIFGGRYDSAMRFLRGRQSEWIAGCRSLGVDARTLIPVVFPELLRRSLLRNELENLGLDTLYVAGGTSAADFSVGVFQMKPSFVESLEKSLAALPSLPASLQCIIDFPDARDERDRRRQRCGRLGQEEWQLRYLAGFDLVVESRFPLASLGVEERIRFLAAAYNHGFWLPRDEIERAGDLRLFPDGAVPGRPPQYRYTDVSVDFYERYWKGVAP